MKFSVPALALLACTPAATTAFHNHLAPAAPAQSFHPAATCTSGNPSSFSSSSSTALSVGSYLDALQESCDGDSKSSSIDECAPAIASYVQAVSTGAEAPANNAKAGQTLAGYLDAIAPAGPGAYSVGEAAGAAASTGVASAAATTATTSTDPAAVAGYLHQVSAGLAPPPSSTQEVTSLLQAIATGATTPRAAFPSSMAHEFRRARMGGTANGGQGGNNMVGYESRRPYTYGRYAASGGLNGMAGSANVASLAAGVPAGNTRTALAATAISTATPAAPPAQPAATAPAPAQTTFSSLYGPSTTVTTATTTPQPPSYPKAAHATSMSAEFARARNSAQNTIGIESRKPAMYASSIRENSTLQALVEEVCDADGPNSEACQSAMTMARYGEARAAWPGGMRQEFQRGRTAQGTVGYESRKPKMYNPKGGSSNYSFGSSPDALLAAVNDFCDVDDASPECLEAKAAYQNARAGHPTSMSAEMARARSSQGTIGIESRRPAMYTAGISENAMLATLTEACDADANSDACQSAIATYSQATETHASSMGAEFSRARSQKGNVVGYESRKPAMYSSGITNNSMLSALNEVCDADGAGSDACKSAIASYNQATETHAASMGQEFGRARTNQGTVGYESRKPAMYTGGISNNSMLSALNEICDADSSSEACKSAIASYNDATETHAASMGQEFGRARTNQGTVGYESRKPTMYTGGVSNNSMLSALNEICDADSSSDACKSAIASYNEATETHAASMGQEFGRARTNQGTVGYESRKPTMYSGGISNNSMLSAMNEVCDADSNSDACRSAIAAYNQATETHAASMGQEFGRARTNQGTVGYESRKPTMYSGDITNNSMLSAMNEVCDADASSAECQQLIAQYNDAKEPWANTMSSEFGRARTNQGTVGYESRKPAMYTEGRGSMFAGNTDTNALLAAANEVCDADSSSVACANAIAAYNDARASWSTNMSDEFARGTTTNAAGTTTVGYPSRRPDMYRPAANAAGITENAMLSTKPNYVFALEEYCQPQAAGTAPSEDCAQAISGYIDAVGAGAAEPSPQVGAGIGSYLDSIAPASTPKAGNSGAAVSGYLDSVAAGAASPPSAPAVKSYLDDVSAGAVTTPSTSGSIMSYLDTLGN